MPQIPKYKLKPLNILKAPIGERIAQLRKGKGFTQEELGEKIGISQKLVAAYENGYSRLYDEMIIRFALALGVSTDTLMGIKIDKKEGYTPSLKIMRRLKKIEELPADSQKKVLQNIDLVLKAIGK